MQEHTNNKNDTIRENHIPEDISEIYVIRKNSKGRERIYGNLKNGWIKMSRIGSVYHRNKKCTQGDEARYNKKFVKPDLYGGADEAVICFPPGKEPYLVTDPPNCGTYNYVSPYYKDIPKLSIKGVIGHIREDLIPYLRK